MTLKSEQLWEQYQEAREEFVKTNRDYLRNFQRSTIAKEIRDRIERLQSLLALSRKEYRTVRHQKKPEVIETLELKADTLYEEYRRVLREESEKEEKRGKTK